VLDRFLVARICSVVASPSMLPDGASLAGEGVRPCADYLTSAFVTSVRPMVMGMINQIVPVNARWAH
jgi:hypothetical protein